MKRFLIVLAAAALPATSAAQSTDQVVEHALARVPGGGRESAAVIKWNADYSYQTLKEGTTGLVCYDRSSERGRRAYAIQCTSRANLDRVAQNRKFRAESTDGAGERALVAAARTGGTRAEGEYGSVWYRIEGNDMESARVHTTIMVPGATTASTGLPTTRDAGGAYIMGAGTDGAHIMVPGR
jgi:hypothetical protein